MFIVCGNGVVVSAEQQETDCPAFLTNVHGPSFVLFIQFQLTGLMVGYWRKLRELKIQKLVLVNKVTFEKRTKRKLHCWVNNVYEEDVHDDEDSFQ